MVQGEDPVPDAFVRGKERRQPGPQAGHQPIGRVRQSRQRNIGAQLSGSRLSDGGRG
jgi:hypothetical protein